ncbi:MAG TPA: hypothetical protein VET30_05470, partial [Pseudoxanthomonas sp.]|nr:hypothetical protein [Pseudoxanthomonas sp.]
MARRTSRTTRATLGDYRLYDGEAEVTSIRQSNRNPATTEIGLKAQVRARQQRLYGARMAATVL